MDIKKHLKITGSSTVSWKDAIVKAISEASKTIDYLSEVKIIEQRANIDGNKISEYFELRNRDTFITGAILLEELKV